MKWPRQRPFFVVSTIPLHGAATPNPLMVRLADEALGRSGRMARAVAGIGRGADAFEGPVLAWMIRD